jgi:hypothetical protein
MNCYDDLKLPIRKGPKFREPWSFNWRKNFVSIMNAVEDYAKRWAKLENEKLDTLSEWVKSIRVILKSRITNIKTKVCTIYSSKRQKMAEPVVSKEQAITASHKTLQK